ncbi:bifunctional diguanylate cyclase/phosphodiesterase [Ruminiclostridium herbifermentans]|uniref:Bifunctional diguanylate cyclase/phosphodiesterase n=1 Tax=Ruminiclostridium herbifermentans TaxID=2488810 RepID=A0A4U7JKP1_9FIRM|nr:bifunctional diguanylate cyclase/phosphodiesterase [Ruminiclostridium herbifermentans]QNU68557.1 bifunctional diguanylate cyclase/phosphodiesterase [Ruminiclostridium herbifermentans]
MKHSNSLPQKKQLPKWTIVISIIIYFIIFIANMQINKFDISLMIGESRIHSLSISGILGQLQMFILVIMVTYFQKQGFTTAIILSIIQIFILISTIIRVNSYSPVSGLAAQITNISVVFIIYIYLKQLDMHSKTITKYAVTDALTGLPNRRAFNDYISTLIENHNSETENFALIMVDLDDFKNINDSVGHDLGDEVLCQVAKRWNYVKNKNEFIARLGGDEFIIIIKNYVSVEDLTQNIKKYSNALSERFIVKDNYFYVSASFGVSLFPRDSKDSSEIFRFADAAMYYSKNISNEDICLYTPSITEMIENNVILEQKVRKALDDNNLYFVLQPQFDTKTKQLRGFETLARMKDENGNQISPNLFIPIAEKTGIITRIDNWIIYNTMLFFRKILDKTTEKYILSVNISVLHLLNKDFLDEIKQMLDETGFPPEQLEIEITESVFISSISKAVEILNELKKIGIRIALDDFGTGYSSLSYLAKLPINMLKIDKSFVDDLLISESGRNYVNAIISIGHIMNFEVLSEGVELQEQLDILANLGSDYIQGYVWGKPMETNDVIKLIDIIEKDS